MPGYLSGFSGAFRSIHFIVEQLTTVLKKRAFFWNAHRLSFPIADPPIFFQNTVVENQGAENSVSNEGSAITVGTPFFHGWLMGYRFLHSKTITMMRVFVNSISQHYMYRTT